MKITFQYLRIYFPSNPILNLGVELNVCKKSIKFELAALSIESLAAFAILRSMANSPHCCNTWYTDSCVAEQFMNASTSRFFSLELFLTKGKEMGLGWLRVNVNGIEG